VIAPREPVATMTARSAELTILLTTLDEFICSSPRIIAELAAFLESRGSRSPEFETGNLIYELSFTALSLRRQAASVPARKERS
jgi:hypothetical protein